ncbi:ABC transporter ATP-binding protein [Prochlorothrix hollandica]|uniref:ABC-type quaternary amine transporter n=1 Tax=Prochlorothrix hollandica PCC 9006 = CALU 1027 TaxID=317619 RepID=A0A0M2PYI8_PROHO|nr:ABC transporter ATP-binding protein [Prochlorothrix hollandica]KKJ01501.1 ABC transporter ATP-binding protein [Prochlorothrix hollandica PCC 9006 = CALU 1027]
MCPAMIEFDRVSLQFPTASHPAVHQVSAHIKAGEVVVILGPSGCGKTTLLKLVNRLYEPTQGQIRLEGVPIGQINASPLRQKMGYVMQQSGLFPHMTVFDNIAVVPKLLGWPKAQIRRRIEELLTLVELPPSHYRHRYPAQLSGGQQQRVGLARALAGDPPILLMDEPFGAIDALTRASLQTEVLRLQAQLQKTILFVSHDVEEALRLGDRIMVMNQGEVVQCDTPLALLTHPATDFVHRLLGADDRVRQLSLLSVARVMTPWNPGVVDGHNIPSLGPDQSLRDALSLLLKTGTNALQVTQDGQAVGLITLNQIRAYAQQV